MRAYLSERGPWTSCPRRGDAFCCGGTRPDRRAALSDHRGAVGIDYVVLIRFESRDSRDPERGYWRASRARFARVRPGSALGRPEVEA